MKALSTYTIIPYKNKFIKLSNLESGKIIYKNYYIDLKTNQKVMKNYSEWVESLVDKIDTYYFSSRVIHLFYELGFLIENVDIDVSNDVILGIDLNYRNQNEVKLISTQKIKLTNVSSPLYSDYQKKFKIGYEHLLAGNCYQFNLTEKFIYHFSPSVSALDFISTLWKERKDRGAFGSATYIPQLNRLFLSNSPECLFHLKGDELHTMPIKGTKSFSHSSEINSKWNELIQDQKCESELFMIADLMRNDLSRIDLPRSVVVEKKAMLVVPKLIHQYSEIKVKLRSHVDIKQILKKIFPGGSITGAPKKRVLELLFQLENRSRGFYCGSTLIMHKEMKAASINIRSADIDFNSSELLYQAGGGITLKSECEDEYREMSYKVKSFIDLLTP